MERLSKTEFTKTSDVKHTGITAGRYVRIELNGLPAEFVTNFQPEMPILVGGLLPHEVTKGFTRIRIKKHRWYKRLLKSNGNSGIKELQSENVVKKLLDGVERQPNERRKRPGTPC